MKATGDVASAESGTAREKVRRIDDLGRVVIPKEIRRTMRIREGGLGCRLGRRFCYAEVSTGHPHPVTDNIDTNRQVLLGDT